MKKFKFTNGVHTMIKPDRMDNKRIKIPPVCKEFKSEIDNGFHRLTAKHFGETYEVEAQINRDGRLQIKVRVWPGIGNDRIVSKLVAGENKRGTIIKLDPENLPDVPEGHYYSELVHDNEHYPVHEFLEHWKRKGLIRAV